MVIIEVLHILYLLVIVMMINCIIKCENTSNNKYTVNIIIPYLGMPHK